MLDTPEKLKKYLKYHKHRHGLTQAIFAQIVLISENIICKMANNKIKYDIRNAAYFDYHIRKGNLPDYPDFLKQQPPHN
jgi:hypothetical protein